MIKIIEKEVGTKLVVEPEVVTLYYVHEREEAVLEIPNARFERCYEIENGNYVISYLISINVFCYVTIDKETKEVMDCSDCFYDWEEAVKQHKIKRKAYCEKELAQFQKKFIISIISSLSVFLVSAFTFIYLSGIKVFVDELVYVALAIAFLSGVIAWEEQ